MTTTPRSSQHEGYEEDVAKPGDPPRPPTEPHGAERHKTRKTLTDPVTGEPTQGDPDTAGVA